MAKRPQLLHDAYLGAILIKGFDGAVETLAGLVIALTGPERIYEWVFRLTAPELGGGQHHPALHAIRSGAAKLASGPHHFVILYLLVHGLLKLGIALALLKGTARWVFPVTSLILTGFIAYMSWRLSLRWSDWLLGAALFDLFTLGLVLNEWRAHDERNARSTQAAKSIASRAKT
ncbi:MAG TPA: DUF2127 domain-containing protein [Rhizomicrobium sp.]|nr:DUF2127 domain-containing protein [Rhizomicrobium sp.]